MERYIYNVTSCKWFLICLLTQKNAQSADKAVDYIQHMRVQHQVDEDVAAALRALQRRIQQLEEKVDTLHPHEQD